MTYCVGLKLDRGLVFMSDTRTNAGVDNISVFQKMPSQIATLQSELKSGFDELLYERNRNRLLTEEIVHIKATKAWKIIEKIYRLRNKLWPF